MPLIVALLAMGLAAGAHAGQDLFDETVAIPRSQWRGIRVPLRARPATVRCEFTVREGESMVRALLMSVEDMERFQQGKSFRIIASSTASRKGAFEAHISRPGEFMVMIDNRTLSRSAVKMDLRVWLDHREGETFEALTAPRGKQFAAGVIGFVWLVVVGGWPGYRIWRAFRRRKDALRGFGTHWV